jgi:GT2 family glycosyltransferase
LHQLSVIIVNYNVRYFLEQALHSVMRATRNIDAEVWVVDNNSVDGSMEMVKSLFPSVKCLENKENLGFSKANNQAIRMSQSRYVLLLNPDTVLQDDTLEKCVAFMDDHSDAGGLGVRMIDGKGQFLPESKRGLPSPAVAFYKMTGLSALFPRSKTFGRYHLKFLNENSIHRVDVLSGAFMLLRSEVLQKIGLLDEDFFMYGEDIDLSYRITQAGYHNYYFPQTTIIHYKGESTKKRSANYVKVFYNAMVLFARKHYSKSIAGRLNVFIQLAIYLRAAIALAYRALSSAWLPILDFLLIYAGYFGITRYWEEYNKYVKGFYPETYFALHIPIYILAVLFCVYLSGGYDKPLSVRRIVRGAAFGALIAFSGYAFLPKSLQFSRAILLLGCAWSIAAPILLRLLMHFLKTGKTQLADTRAYRIAIVAGMSESQRIEGLLTRSMVKMDAITRVSPDNSRPEGFAGSLEQVAEVVDIFNVNLVIFSAADVVSSHIMEVMSHLSGKSVQFKIVPEGSHFVIGSNSKDERGELFTLDLSFTIENLEIRRKKRILDLGLVGVLFLFAPLLLMFKKGRFLMAHWFKVLWGKETWVSYAYRPNTDFLPRLKPGCLYPGMLYANAELETAVNLNYARDYHVYQDLHTIWLYLTQSIVYGNPPTV